MSRTARTRTREDRSDVQVTENGDAIYMPTVDGSSLTATEAPAAPAPTAKPEAPKESKSQKFKRLANIRVPRAIKCLRHVIALASAASYDSTEDQRRLVIKLIGEAYEALRRAFAREGAVKEVANNLF